MANPRWYDYDEASALLGWTPATIKKYCDQRKIRYKIKTVYAGGKHQYRYRVISSTEIVRLQTLRLARWVQGGKGRAVPWPT